MPKKNTSGKSHQLKNLHCRRHELSNRVANQALRTKQGRSYQAACKELKQVTDRITRIQRNQIVMTEHALLRYLERVVGVDLDKICDAVINPSLIDQIDTLGDGKYPIGDGYRVVVKNHAIITVVG